MNTDLTTYEQVEEELEKEEASHPSTPLPEGVNPLAESIEDVPQTITRTERLKRISSLIVIAFISLLTGNKNIY